MSNELTLSAPRPVKVYGRNECGRAYAIRDLLHRADVPFEWTEVTTDELCRELNVTGPRDRRLPLCIFPDGTRLERPTNRQIIERLGWFRDPSRSEYDVAIYGAGPAGLSAAVYAASEGLKTVVIKGVGHLAGGTTIVAHATICSTGVAYRRLGLPNDEKFLNVGLYYGAGSSEANICVNEHVFVVGGGNSAGQAAMHFSRTAKKVTIVIRGDGLKATLSQYLLDRIMASPNVEVLPHTLVTALHGDLILRSITLANNRTGQQQTVDTRFLFLCLGGQPHTQWVADVGICRDEDGYLVTGPDLNTHGVLPVKWPLERAPYYLETSMPGLFAAGDVRHGSIKRCASAVGEGAMAVTFVHRYLPTI
jgi:thioredoxin reductase (NADPH)